jgi:hypothetical protein
MELMGMVYNFGFYIYVKLKRYGNILHSVKGISIKIYKEVIIDIQNEVGGIRRIYNVISEVTILSSRHEETIKKLIKILWL